MSPRKTVVITDSLNPAGVELIQQAANVVFLDKDATAEVQAKTLASAHVIITQIYPITREIIANAPLLVAIAKHGVGIDNIDVQAATDHNVPVLYTPGANARSVAEHALGMILSIARRLPELDAAVRRSDFSVRKDLHLHDLRGATLAVLGAGHTGRNLLEICCGALGMRGIAYDLFAPASPLPYNCEYTNSITTALSRADIVSVHLPLTPETKDLVGADELALMPAGAILVNVGRGGVVNETALAEAVDSGHLFGAGVDVFIDEPPAPDNPLLRTGLRIITSPHAAGLSAGASRAIGEMVADDVLKVLTGARPENLVNPGTG